MQDKEKLHVPKIASEKSQWLREMARLLQ
jgi:hypothetical protein